MRGAGRTLVPGAVALSVMVLGCGSPRDLTGGPGGGLDPLVIATVELPAGTVGVAYSAALSATGGDGIYTWSLAEGALPDGLSLSVDGTISGTPTVAETASFVTQVSSGDGQIVTKQLSLEIEDGRALSRATMPDRS